MDVVGGKFNAAKKDNDFVYHEKEPELETLDVIKGLYPLETTYTILCSKRF